MCHARFYIVLLAVVCNPSSAFPQDWQAGNWQAITKPPSSAGQQQSYDWKSKSSQGGGDDWGGDEELEMIPTEILEQNKNYEIRQYPATKWICTTMENIDPLADPMNGWQNRLDNDPLKAMSSDAWKQQISSKMFMKLFRYSAGANLMGEEVKMTTPVPTKHTSELDGLEKQVMCFWLGSAWQDKPAPMPLPNDAQDTKIVEGQLLKVYVRQFGGFAISYNDWADQYNQLKSDLKAAQVQFNDDGTFYHLSYNSPFEMENRRNEIWVEVKE